ncbi:HTTM domain-containing protein [Leptobacterium flavescens]|uniref:HTTM domain-containing protein n=1 Tax=Leptobacterium flavescens TaxID=472055 RepID=A0A6P0UKG9_9FLAO|nr:HTTM domain-containing protein [Leptobacterium flavescens]NER12910.1 HTTM domain-containing protein [Leptobacterium flavescens]
MHWLISKKEKFDQFLFRPIDNAPLIVFRIIFGLLIFLESVGAIFTGWIRRTLIEPDFTFNFIGLDWLQPLPGHWMYVYYAVMGVFGLLVMIGYRYRLSLGFFTIMWTATYLMQKASYNNHYYLLIIICLIMILLPAERYASADVRRKPQIKALSMPNWCSWIIIIQLWIVYTYASVAKLYPDWLDTTVVENLMLGRKDYPIIGDFLQLKTVHYVITYTGIIFDLLIIPTLLWKPTRKLAFAASIVFHIFNSIVLQIGIFPYLSLAFTLFFFEPEKIRSIFLKKKPVAELSAVQLPLKRNLFIALGAIYFVIQIGLPLRHWVIKDDVLWTEEGHRMSWRMMLRSKSGYVNFKVVDKNTGETVIISPKNHLSRKQYRMIGTKPDVIWQFVQYLKKDFAEKGKDVSIYAMGKISVNRSPYKTLIDPEVDLAAEKWSHFRHHSWILPSEKE